MSYRILWVSLLIAVAVAMASAQTKATMSGKCEKPKVQQSISIPDQPVTCLPWRKGRVPPMATSEGRREKRANIPSVPT